MKIVISDGHLGSAYVAGLDEAFPGVTFVTPNGADDQKREIADADAYIGLPTNDVFRAAKKLRWVHCVGTGVDKYYTVVPDIFKSDVVLTNARGPHAPPMADHVFLVMLGLAHRATWQNRGT